MAYYVYLIVSEKNQKTISYVGYTNNLKNRLILHNKGKGAKFTRGRNWRIVYYKKFSTKSEAMIKEYRLKKNYKLRNKLKNKNLN